MFDSFPPPDFIPTPSKIPGIEVYKPKPPAEDHQPVVEFSCPQCGHQTAYSAADGGLTCQSCGYYEPPQQAAIGRDAEDFEFTVETMTRAAHGWGEARKELQCQSCGVHTSLSVDMLTHTCPFCDSNKVIQHQAPQDVLRPRFLIPFAIEVAQCEKIARQWLGRHWMTSNRLKRAMVSESFDGIYIPYWTFDADLDAVWKAEVGRIRKLDNKRVWRWEEHQAKAKADDLLVPGTTHLGRRLIKQIGDYKLDALAPYEASYLAGFQAQHYDILLDEAWEQARHHMRQRVKRQCQAQVKPAKIRNFSMQLDFNNESWRYILLPIYVSAYRHRNKVYQVLVNGQTGTIAGQRPVDWLKVSGIIGLIMLPTIIAFITGTMMLNYAQADPSPAYFLGTLCFLIGFIMTIKVLSDAMKMGQA